MYVLVICLDLLPSAYVIYLGTGKCVLHQIRPGAFESRQDILVRHVFYSASVVVLWVVGVDDTKDLILRSS